MIIGLDFDNTIADYGAVFPRAAVRMGLLADGEADGKAAVRARLRARPDGERDWQRLQGQVYGRFMPEATPMPGLDRFLAAARRRGCRVLVVSHKTRFGHFDESRTDLRQAALAWMDGMGFFSPDGFGLDRADIYFEETREAKVRRIAAVDPDLFVDDLPEVFAEPGFPARTRRILYGADTSGGGGFDACADWDAVARMVFP